MGGNFTTVSGQTRNRIARLNVDGTLDLEFNPGASGGSVFTLALQADGKILLGGDFATLGGQTRHRIGRLNTDGTLDLGFNPGANNYVYSLAVQTDGRILEGGSFLVIGGELRDFIARLSADGTPDAGFDPGANSGVYSVAIQPDGKILTAGYFTTLGGQPRYGVARLSNTHPSAQSLSHADSPSPGCGAVPARRFRARRLNAPRQDSRGRIWAPALVFQADGKSRSRRSRSTPPFAREVRLLAGAKVRAGLWRACSQPLHRHHRPLWRTIVTLESAQIVLDSPFAEWTDKSSSWKAPTTLVRPP